MSFCKFLESLLENTKFWKNAKPSTNDLMNHDIFLVDENKGIEQILQNQKTLVDNQLKINAINKKIAEYIAEYTSDLCWTDLIEDVYRQAELSKLHE